MDAIPRETRTYKYKRLDHPPGRTAIRLIHLQSSDEPEAPLRCYFSSTSVTCIPSAERDNYLANYYALSYTWGDPEPSEVLHIINPLEKAKPKLDVYGMPTRESSTPLFSRIRRKLSPKASSSVLPITKSLYQALRHLRAYRSRWPPTELIIWVDAVSIDQSNTEEKTVQLEAMGLIYKSAHRVIVWLGLETPMEDGEKCMKLLEELASFQGGFGKKNISMLDAFFNREYFRRRWTVQERYFAHIGFTAVCGDTQMWWEYQRYGPAFERLHTALDGVECNPNTRKRLAGALPRYQLKPVGCEGEKEIEKEKGKDELRAKEKETMLDFMLRFSDTKCFDPRDMVLSVLAVVVDAYPCPLRPAKVGYTSTIEEVFTSMARALYYNLSRCKSSPTPAARDDILQSLPLQSVDIQTLSTAESMRAPAADITKLEIASWIPDWRRTTLSYDIYKTEDRWEEEDNHETGPHGSELSPFIFSQGKVNGLCCMAERFDSIKTLIPLPDLPMRAEDTILSMVLRCVPQMKRAIPNASAFVHEIASILVLKSFAEEVCVHFTNDKTQHKELLPNASFAGLRDRLILHIATLFSESYDQRLHNVMRGRTLFISERDVIGLCPATSKLGDQIWKLDGTFVLRELEGPGYPSTVEWSRIGVASAPPTYQVVGEAFIPLRGSSEDNEPARMNKLVDMVNRINPGPSTFPAHSSDENNWSSTETTPLLASNGFKSTLSHDDTLVSMESSRTGSTQKETTELGFYVAYTFFSLATIAQLLIWLSSYLPLRRTIHVQSVLESSPDTESSLESSVTQLESKPSPISYPVTKPCVQCGRTRDHPSDKQLSRAELYIPESPILDDLRSAMDRNLVEPHLRWGSPFTYRGELLYSEPDKVFVPEKCRLKVIQTMHVHLLGHFGPKVTIMRIEKWAYWEDLGKDVRNFVGACEMCQSARNNRKQICLL